MLVIVLAFGMTVVSCDNGTTTDNNGNNIDSALNGTWTNNLGGELVFKNGYGETYLNGILNQEWTYTCNNGQFYAKVFYFSGDEVNIERLWDYTINGNTLIITPTWNEINTPLTYYRKEII